MHRALVPLRAAWLHGDVGVAAVAAV